MTSCRGDDPDCTGGWIPVVQVHQKGRVVETRDFGAEVQIDPDLREKALAVFAGQQAYEAVKPCRFCKPNFVHPDDRHEEEPVDQSKALAVEGERWWDQ